MFYKYIKEIFMSEITILLIAVAIMVPVSLIVKKLLKNFDDIDPKK